MTPNNPAQLSPSGSALRGVSLAPGFIARGFFIPTRPRVNFSDLAKIEKIKELKQHY